MFDVAKCTTKKCHNIHHENGMRCDLSSLLTSKQKTHLAFTSCEHTHYRRIELFALVGRL